MICLGKLLYHYPVICYLYAIKNDQLYAYINGKHTLVVEGW